MSVTQKKCGKCDKTVYPTEEIKCLDKVWHRGCLKCTTCGSTLNIKNVKGYDKMPYCEVHYPQLKPTPTGVASNPEMQRIKQLTDIQSNVKYHKDFNENKGKHTVITDDQAIVRAKEQQRTVSQVEYTGKRKDSTSQDHHPPQQQQQQQQEQSNDNNQASNVSEATVGRVADYDPINENRGSLARGYEPTSKGLHGAKFEVNQMNSLPTNPKSDNNENLPVQEKVETQPSSDNVHHDDQSKPNSHDETRPSQMKVRALYSYTAAEEDEISFNEGDILIQCEEVDAGWMLGHNEKTGKQGLLPSNYVEIIH